MSVLKVLVANRSEIACRIFQACREIGLHSVGIFSPEDKFARHVPYADEMHSVSSYLDIDSILKIAKASKVSFIHPGYGFLSESSKFAEAVEQTGIGFIGPRPETIALMGNKIAAKKFVESLGVPTLPWMSVKTGEDLYSAASTVGFPLLLKASAGGGGKGMRLVTQPQDFLLASESASAEARSAFGDETLFLEKCLDSARHIEVQVFGDGNGDGVHFYERECSLQRRHQKIWEEAPSVTLSLATKNALFSAALKIVHAAQYRSVGTIEFLVDSYENYYFLEMNTRLQVEHPVTELVTGVDLVCAQLLQAQDPSYFSTAFLQESRFIRGHAIEVRLCAEDPSQGFTPSMGKVCCLRWPTGVGIRVESGIEMGQEIGPHFDSMLGKLIVFAENRSRALDRLRFALQETVILGVKSNQSYLLSLTQHPVVQKNEVDIHFLEKKFNLPQVNPPSLEYLTYFKHFSETKKNQSISPWAFFDQKKCQNKWTSYPGGWFLSRDENGQQQRCLFWHERGEIGIHWGGQLWHGKFVLDSLYTKEEKFDKNYALFAQFPGKLRKILVLAHQSVEEGDPLVLVEAMKMEFLIRSPRRGVVQRILVQEGQIVSEGDIFLDFKNATYGSSI